VIVFLLSCDPKRVTGRIIYSDEAELILDALAQGREQ
jgi:hypothetical protein